MNTMLWMWIVSAAVMVVTTIVLGAAIRKVWSGAFIDNRGRYSLTQFQIVMWSIVILSLISGVFFGRLDAGVADPLGFDIPPELLLLMGISVGSTALSTGIKSTKDQTRERQIVATPKDEKARLVQLFTVEEGTDADTLDTTKFQNFWLTLILLVAYVTLAADALSGTAAADLEELPSFDGTFVTLLGISHAAYLAGKLPNRGGEQEVVSSLAKRRGHEQTAARTALQSRADARAAAAARAAGAGAEAAAPPAPPTTPPKSD